MHPLFMELYTKSLDKKIITQKLNLKKRLNISLLNILLKSTNSNILGHSLQEKM